MKNVLFKNFIWYKVLVFALHYFRDSYSLYSAEMIFQIFVFTYETISMTEPSEWKPVSLNLTLPLKTNWFSFIAITVSVIAAIMKMLTLKVSIANFVGYDDDS